MRRPRILTRVLIIVVAALFLVMVLAVVAETLLRSRIESELSATNSPAELSLGSGSVVWGYVTGSVQVDAHLDADQMKDALSSTAGLDVGDITLSGGAIRASLDGGPLTTFFGGDVVVELVPEAVDGQLTIAMSGLTVGGEDQAGTALASQLGPIAIGPAEMTGCAALADATVDGVSVAEGEMIVSASVPTDAAVVSSMRDCAATSAR